MKQKWIVFAIIGLCIISLSYENNVTSVKPVYKGRAFWGMVAAEATDANIPSEYAGVLINPNITLYGPNVTLLVKPFILFPSTVTTNGTVNLHMRFFWGTTQKTNNTAQLGGWGYDISWEWEE